MAPDSTTAAGNDDSGGTVHSRQSFTFFLILATMTSTVAFVDRAILNILAEPIKRDIGFSDTQLGLLTGFAFAVFYSLVGIPIARYVDRPHANRPLVISVCLAVWSGMTVVSGFVTSYTQLLIARMFIAIGESGGGPAILTLLDHYVTPDKRSRVFALYGLGVPIGTLLGLVLGGWLADLFGWRAAFIVVGAPGLLLAVAMWMFVQEPRKGMVHPISAQSEGPSIRQNIQVIVKSPAVMWLIAAASTGGMFVFGLPSWGAVYLIRNLELSPTHAGLILGLIMGIGGGLGTFLGGVLADKLSANDPGRALVVPCLGLLVGIPAGVIAMLTDDWRVFASFYWIAIMGGAAAFGPVMALVQRLVPINCRATTTIILITLINLIGGGLGPTLVGIASDLFTPRYGVEGLRWVLLLFNLMAFVPALLYLKAAAYAADAIERVVD